MGFPLKTCPHILPSAVGRIQFWLCCTVFSHAPMRNIGFFGRWGTYACPQCLPSDIVPIRSWTRTLRRPGIRHRHLPYHTIPPYHRCLLPCRYGKRSHWLQLIRKPRPLAVIRNRRLNSVALLDPLRSTIPLPYHGCATVDVQFSSVRPRAPLREGGRQG